MLRSRIAAVLDDLAISIEHVGSTAVPGLAAKPVIDIHILLRSSDDLPLVIRRLAKLGYQHRGDLGVRGREAFRVQGETVRHHLYVCLPESCEYKRHIAFRNYLREHAADADDYALLKRELARTFRSDREGYNQAKSEFVQRILQCTLEEHSHD
jgi:GrpB-like predicted nucleotidyltransferase (UPF0157 family)